jgi:hypothetical protein
VWLRYLAEAIVHTAGRPRMLMFFEDYFEDWRAQVERLAGFIGHPERAGQPQVAGLATTWLDPGLWHHRSRPLDAIADAGVPIEVKSLYLAARRSSPGGNDELLDALARTIETEQGWNSRPLIVRPPKWASQPG